MVFPEREPGVVSDLSGVLAGKKKRIYLAAMGRSGSTALASRLSSDRGKILVEPFLFKGGNSFFYRDMKSRGWKPHYMSLLKKRIYAANPSALVDDIEKHYTQGYDYWGVKEVFPELHRPTIDILLPDYIVITTRDIRDVALSLTEKHIKEGIFGRVGWSWIETYIRENARALCSLAHSYENVIHVKYEDLFFNESTFDGFFKTLGITERGDDFSYIDVYGRSWEKKRAVSRKKESLSLEERGLAGHIKPSSLDELAGSMEEYNATFGYGNSESS